MFSDSFFQLGQEEAFHETARFIALALGAAFLKYLARNDGITTTTKSYEFSKSYRRMLIAQWTGVLHLLLGASLFFFLPRVHIQFVFSETVIIAVAAVTALTAGALLLINIYLWPLDRPMARRNVLFLVLLFTAFGLGYRYIN